MANTIKITKKDRFTEIRDILKELGKDELVEFIDHEVELLSKKSTSKKAVANQTINAELDERILELLGEYEDGLTASQILNKMDVSGIEGLADLSLPKINTRLTALGKEQKVDRKKEKKVVLFKLGTGDGFSK
jgi:hypothetical protein